MIYIVIGLIVMIAAAVFGVSGARGTRKNGSSDTCPAASAEEGSAESGRKKELSADSTSTEEAEIDTTKYLTRVEAESLLLALAKSPPPTGLRPIGAMCYEMASPTEVTYVCPKCGERTLYTAPWGHFVRSIIPSCRRVMDTIVRMPVELDETQFCKNCSPQIESPELCLLLRYKGEETHHRICAVSLEDVTLLSEFLAGKDRHIHWNDRESALKLYVDRLEEILNLELEPDSSEQRGEPEDEH